MKTWNKVAFCLGMAVSTLFSLPATAVNTEADFSFVLSSTIPPVVKLTTTDTPQGKMIVAFDGGDKIYRLQPFIQSIALREFEGYNPPPALLSPNLVPGTFAARGTGDIGHAWISQPVNQSSPSLGLAQTGRGLSVKMKTGETVEYTVPAGGVIEDVYPHIIDLGSDGYEEILATLRTGKGVAVGLFVPTPEKLRLIGITKPASEGQWVGSVGASDVDGDGNDEIIVISDPASNGWLEFYGLDRGTLRQDARYYGFSNLVTGTPQIAGAMITDVNADGISDILAVRSDRQSISAVRFSENGMEKILHYSVQQLIMSDLYVRTMPDSNHLFRQAAFLTRDGSIGMLSKLPLEKESLLK